MFNKHSLCAEGLDVDLGDDFGHDWNVLVALAVAAVVLGALWWAAVGLLTPLWPCDCCEDGGPDGWLFWLFEPQLHHDEPDELDAAADEEYEVDEEVVEVVLWVEDACGGP